MGSKYLGFCYRGKSDSGKTEKYNVYNKVHGMLLGEIKWHGAFRKYGFFPILETVFDSQCLKEIGEFLDKMMRERKEKDEQ